MVDSRESGSFSLKMTRFFLHLENIVYHFIWVIWVKLIEINSNLLFQAVVYLTCQSFFGGDHPWPWLLLANENLATFWRPKKGGSALSKSGTNNVTPRAEINSEWFAGPSGKMPGSTYVAQKERPSFVAVQL